MIPLYNPLPTPPLPANLTTLQWDRAQTEVEGRLREFLDVGPELDVMLVDRATHGLEVVFRLLRERLGLHAIRIPNRTYRAAKDAAQSAGFTEVQTVADIRIRPAPVYLAVPTTLGGLAIPDVLDPTTTGPAVVDAAHTCFPGMFSGVRLSAVQAAVLSFYPTKPMGAFGGGAVVGALPLIESLRPHVSPGPGPCKFYYPQTVQSAGILARITTYSEAMSRSLIEAWQASAGLIFAKFGLRPAWSKAVPTSPHMLAVTGSEEARMKLFEFCGCHQIETGAHYPPLNGRGRPHISVPFWSAEFLQLLANAEVSCPLPAASAAE
jgi:hypothetical protein